MGNSTYVLHIPQIPFVDDSPRSFCRVFCQFVAPFIFRMTVVGFNPMEKNFMYLQEGEESFPKVSIFDRFFGRGHPSVFNPCLDPFFGNRIANIT